MKKLISLLSFVIIVNTCFAKKLTDKIKKEEKVSYNDYMLKYGENDTTAAIISVFYDKRENSGAGQMSFLPITGSLCIVSPPIGISLSIITAPIFLNGFITYKRHNNKNLEIVLNNYLANGYLSKRLKRRVLKQLEAESYLD